MAAEHVDVRATSPESPAGAPRDQLRKVLGLPDVIAQSLSVIAPAMSGAFLTYLVATKAGGATPLAFLLATVGALCIGTVVAGFARGLSSAGSLYTYVTKGIGRGTGFLVGWAYASAFLLLGGAVLCGFGFFGALFVQTLAGAATAPVPWYVFSLVGLVAIALMSMFRIEVSTRSQLVFLVLTVATLVVTSVMVIGGGEPETGRSLTVDPFVPSAAGVDWVAIMVGLGFAVLSFTGAEASAVLSEETRDPKRTIPKAVIGSVLLAGAFYLLVTYATSIGFGVTAAVTEWPASVAGLAAVAPNQTVGVSVLASAAVASFFCALGVHNAVSRVLFAMGRERVLPTPLGRLNARYHVPWTAILFTLVTWTVVVVVLLALTSAQTQVTITGDSYDPGVTPGVFAFTVLAGFGTPLVMLVYLLVGLAGIRFGLGNRRGLMVVGGIGAGLTGVLAVIGGVYYSFVPAAPGTPIPALTAAIPWVCLGIVALGSLVALVLRARNHEAWSDMGLLFEDV